MIDWNKNMKDKKSVEMLWPRVCDVEKQNSSKQVGASLCDGRVVNGRIERPFHKRCSGEDTHPDFFGGHIRNDALCMEDEIPITFLNFSSLMTNHTDRFKCPGIWMESILYHG